MYLDTYSIYTYRDRNLATFEKEEIKPGEVLAD